MKVRYYAALAGAAALIAAGGTVANAATGHRTPPQQRVTCEAIATVIVPPVGMPANYDFQLCGVGMPQIGISCPSGLPQPGRTETCVVATGFRGGPVKVG